MVSTLRDWFVMLATTRMTKSFKMVLLRVLLDRVSFAKDAAFAGMPIPELAAKCREFLVAHEFLRRVYRSCGQLGYYGLQGAEVAAAVQDSSDLKAVRSGTKKDHVHTDRHTAASSDPESRS